MRLDTTRFGEIEIKDEKIVYFEEGLLGFEKARKFTILSGEADSLFKWLQCLDDGSLAFIVVEPDLFVEEFYIDLSDSDVRKLNVESPDDVNILCIVTIPEDTKKISVNLQGPIVINSRKKLGRQVISTNEAHKLRYYLLEAKRGKR